MVIFSIELASAIRSRWFWLYTLFTLVLIGGIFFSGVTESRVMGFTGLTRLLIIFIQACNLILPIFILISTVRTLVKEKENSVFEYLLSYPLSLKEYFFGKALSRFIIVSIPLILSMVLAVILSFLKGQQIPWSLVFLYLALLVCSSFFYVSLAFLISSLVRTQEASLGLSLFIWLVLIALIDVALLGLMIKSLVPEEVIFTIALLNPIQIFKIAAISLFDPVLSVIGPASYFILDIFGANAFIWYALGYFVLLGLFFLFFGYKFFSRKDLL